MFAQPRVKMAVNRLDKLGAVPYVNQQSAHNFSAHPEATGLAECKNVHEHFLVHIVGLHPCMLQ